MSYGFEIGVDINHSYFAYMWEIGVVKFNVKITLLYKVVKDLFCSIIFFRN